MDDILASIRKIISEDPDSQGSSTGGQDKADASQGPGPSYAPHSSREHQSSQAPDADADVAHQDYSAPSGTGPGAGSDGAPFRPGGMSARPTRDLPRDGFSAPRRGERDNGTGQPDAGRAFGPDPFADYRPGGEPAGSARPMADDRHDPAEPSLTAGHRSSFDGGPAGWPERVDTSGDPRLPFENLDSFAGDSGASDGRTPGAGAPPAAHDRDVGRDAFADRDRSFEPGADRPADWPPFRASDVGEARGQRTSFGFEADPDREPSGYEPRMSEFVTADTGPADRGPAFSQDDAGRRGGDDHWPGDEQRAHAQQPPERERAEQVRAEREPAADEPVVLDAPLRGARLDGPAGDEASPGATALADATPQEDYVELGAAIGADGAEPLDPFQPVGSAEPVRANEPEQDEVAAMSFEENARRQAPGFQTSNAPAAYAIGDADRRERATPDGSAPEASADAGDGGAAAGPAPHLNGRDPEAEPEPVDLGALARPAGEAQSSALRETEAGEAGPAAGADPTGEPSTLELGAPVPVRTDASSEMADEAANAEATDGASPNAEQPEVIAVSPAGDSVVAGQAQAVAAAADPGGRTVEDMVAGLLKPVLREWLDDNMPRIIEKAISKDDLLAAPDDEADKS